MTPCPPHVRTVEQWTHTAHLHTNARTSLQQYSSSPTSAGEKEVDANHPDCKNNDNNTELDLSDQVLSSKWEFTRLHLFAGSHWFLHM